MTLGDMRRIITGLDVLKAVEGMQSIDCDLLAARLNARPYADGDTYFPALDNEPNCDSFWPDGWDVDYFRPTRQCHQYCDSYYETGVEYGDCYRSSREGFSSHGRDCDSEPSF